MDQGNYLAESGVEVWYKDGKWHREDGPAIIYPSGKKEYYLNMNYIEEKDYLKVLNCPLEELPLYINTELAPIVRRRLNHDTNN